MVTNSLHKPCGICGEMESVDFMVRVDDDYYCIGCDEKNERKNLREEVDGRTQPLGAVSYTHLTLPTIYSV